MKKIILLLLTAVTLLALLTSCASKVEIEENAVVVIAYQLDGTSVTSTLTGANASLVINNLNGLEIQKEAPKGAEYAEGDEAVYFMVGDNFYHIDLNGSPVMMIGKNEGYVELEQFRYDAIIALYDQFGVTFDFNK